MQVSLVDSISNKDMSITVDMGQSTHCYFLFNFSLKGERGSPGPVGPPGEKGVTVSHK